MTPPPGAPRVAVVIVNYNAGAYIERTLDTLGAQRLAPARVVVVDNASTDGSADLVARVAPDAELVRLERNVGFAAANNAGIERVADCEWVALLNPDAYPEPGWLERLLAAAQEHPSFSFFASCMLQARDRSVYDGTGDVYHVSGVAWRRDYGVPVAQARRDVPEEVFGPCAAAAMYRRDDLLAVHGFDERYFAYLEDVDLAFRLRLQGGRCLYVPDAVVLHEGSVTTGYDSDFTLFLSHRNIVWTWVKNLSARMLLRHGAQFLLLNVAIVVWFAVRGRGRPLLDAKRAALRELPRVLEQRRAIQAGRRVGDDAIDPFLDGKFVAPYLTAVHRIREDLAGRR